MIYGFDVVYMFVDGVYEAVRDYTQNQAILCAWAMCSDGTKEILHLGCVASESTEAWSGFFEEMTGRGLRKAIEVVFGELALVQRCQTRKRENVTSYLNKEQSRTYRKKMQRAYQQPTYEEAKEALMEIHAELTGLNRSAANSLMEGLEETLTLHQLGVFEQVGRTLKTTIAIESVNSQVDKYIGKVKRWHHSEKRHRWLALGLLEAEQNMRRIAGYRELPKLRAALQTELNISTKDHEEGPPSEN